MNKVMIILLALTALVMVGCDIMPMDSLHISAGDKYIISSKTKKANEEFYRYRVIKFGEPEYYDYLYKDSTNFSVGDTIIIITRRVGN